ncbi:MAG: BTAD domain-containing putative transcriptional regulator, partial [Vulcanimicrobiota bacterium]
LLAYLASRWDRPVVEDELIELFWPEARGTGKRNLYVAATTLRKALRPNQEAKEVDFVVRHQNRLGLNLQLPIWHDASEAESAWSKAQEALRVSNFADACDCFRQLCELSGGDFLEGCYLDWAVRRRSQWAERFSQAALHLCKAALDRKAWDESIEWARRSLEWEPADLDAHQALLRAYLGQRQPEAVIRGFEAAAQRLKRDYEMEPSTEMLELYHRARHGIYS